MAGRRRERPRNLKYPRFLRSREATGTIRALLSPLQMLTAREQEVLRRLADGKRVKEIAHVLSISAKTVESHRQNLMDKLEIHSTVEFPARRADFHLIGSWPVSAWPRR